MTLTDMYKVLLQDEIEAASDLAEVYAMETLLEGVVSRLKGLGERTKIRQNGIEELRREVSARMQEEQGIKERDERIKHHAQSG